MSLSIYKTKPIVTLSLVIICALVSLNSCKKPVMCCVLLDTDCEKNNYGIVTINYSANNVRHSIIISADGSQFFREKISPIGKLNDTVRLTTGLHRLTISSINNQGLVIDALNPILVDMAKCGGKTIEANF